MPKGPMLNTPMTIALIALVVGILMIALPPLLFGAAEGDREAAGPFAPTIVGYFVALAGAAGLLVAWIMRRRKR